MDLDDQEITTPAPGLTGQGVDLALLSYGKGAKRVVSGRRQRLYLDSNTMLTAPGYDIEFTAADPDIAIENF